MTSQERRDMSKADVAMLLTLMASFDQRTIGDADVEAWHATAQYAHWNTAGARRAVVAHYAETKQRMMPADVTEFLRDPDESGQRICQF
jgi:hypothetical protein